MSDTETIETPVESVESSAAGPIDNMPTIDDIFTPPEPAKAPEATEEKTVEKPADEGKPDEVTAEKDPNRFQEDSQKAFYSEDGSINSDKLLGFIDDKGGFLETVKYNQDAPNDTDAKTDPASVYSDAVLDVATNYQTFLDNEIAEGYTAEQSLGHLKAYFDELAATKGTQLEKLQDREDIKNEMRSEFQTERAQAVQAKIDTVTNKLSERYTGLIPGMSGREAFDAMVLDNGLGGGVAKALFNRDNPGFGNIPQEQQEAVKTNWLNKFQSSEADMALAAEVGEARWLKAQLPNMFQKAMKMGAEKVRSMNGAISGASKLNGITPPASTGKDTLNGFL